VRPARACELIRRFMRVGANMPGKRCGRCGRPLSARDRQRARHHSYQLALATAYFISIVMKRADLCCAEQSGLSGNAQVPSWRTWPRVDAK